MMLFKYEEIMKFVIYLENLVTYYNQEVEVNLLFWFHVSHFHPC